jgi:hypothetical protein
LNEDETFIAAAKWPQNPSIKQTKIERLPSNCASLDPNMHAVMNAENTTPKSTDPYAASTGDHEIMNR